MSQRANERVAYFNGDFLPESQVLVSFRDRSFMFGDGVFDTARTFGHKVFRLDEHIDRLFRSLRYLRIDPGLGRDELARVSEEVVARNLHLIAEDEDYWLTQRITRGLAGPAGTLARNGGPTVIVECVPLPLADRAHLYRDGIEVVIPSVRRTPPEAFSPRAKSHNYLNLIMADLEAKAQTPAAWAVLLDMDGNVTEGMGSNFFTVFDGRLATPRERFVLPGISRQTVMELAEKLGIACAEADIDNYDVYTADEVFLTSTSLCLCPVRSVNGAPIGDGRVPGPVTRRLMEAYAELVDFDWVGQYLARLDG